MSDAREYISNLDMPEKITLFKDLYNELAGYGMDGDTELAHVNTFEASLLKSLGGSGTINDITNLREYKGGGQQQQAPPAQQSVTQTAEFPTELKPFISDVLGEGKAEFQREKGEGFQAFPGPQIAQFTPEQQAAFATGREQFTGLAGTPLAEAATYYQPALAATALGTAEIGAEDIGRRMDPFLQNVVDIAKREARTDEDIARQQRAAQAVSGQGFLGGTRPAFVEAQAGQDLAERLGDIQARGLSASFQQAQQAAEQQRAREMTGGRQFAALGDTTGARARSDIAGLAGIGETQQQRSQQALDIAQREFEQEKAFPQTALQRYASLIRGFPLQATQQRFATQTVPTPSLAQTLVGGLGTGAGLYGAFGGFNPRAEGGLVALQQGGLPGAQVAMGNVGGANVSPAATPMQRTMPTPQDVQKALELMRQRGKAIRQMSLPQVPQTTLPSQIPPQSLSGVLPAAEGGLMSVVKRATDGPLNTTPYTLGELSGKVRDLSSMEFYDPEKLKIAQQKRQEQLKYFGDRESKLTERLEGLDEREYRDQMQNVANLMLRLGTDVSPAAQVPGIAGLLGAGVSAAKETAPEFKETREGYYDKRMGLEDIITDIGGQKLQAEADIAQSDFDQASALLAAERGAAEKEVTLGTDIVAEASSIAGAYPELKGTDWRVALSNLASIYPNAILKTTAQGDVSIDGSAMNANESSNFGRIKATYTQAMLAYANAHPNASTFEVQQAGEDAAMPAIRHMINTDQIAREARRKNLLEDENYAASNQNVQDAMKEAGLSYEAWIETKVDIPDPSKLHITNRDSVKALQENPDLLQYFADEFKLTQREAEWYLTVKLD